MRRAAPLAWWTFVLGFVLTGLVLAAEPATTVATSNAGEAIYRRGELPSGAPLEASRDAATHVQSAAVACINCHRRSGLGSKEGRNLIPPVAGRYLFQSRNPRAENAGLPYVEGMRADRNPYSDETLARAIREGVDSEGKALSFLMPRFVLNDTDLASLIAYLNQLGPRMSPGVSDSVLHFATIITPDADPVKRRGVLDVLEHFFADRNSHQRAPAPELLPSGRATFSRMMVKPVRQWQLHVWELSGPAASWQAQLERHLAAQPVFAVVSGLGGTNWAPVHAFCERAALPCLFPNVELPPPDADRDVYSLYFSKGVLLEADLIAKGILEAGGGRAAATVRQVYRAGDAGELGAKALAEALQRHGVAAVSHVLPVGGAPGDGVGDALRASAGADALVLWLRPGDVAALENAPAEPTSVFVSGLMGGLERTPLPSKWRERTRMAYPVDLPDRRRVRVDYALGWFRIRHIPVVAIQEQVDTYLACGLLSETLSHMVDTFVRDYLVERIEDMIEHRVITGYYPRLTLGSGQRFASKGGYIVRFAGLQGTTVVADGEWTVP